jgi:hypothetical protein
VGRYITKPLCGFKAGGLLSECLPQDFSQRSDEFAPTDWIALQPLGLKPPHSPSWFVIWLSSPGSKQMLVSFPIICFYLSKQWFCVGDPWRWLLQEVFQEYRGNSLAWGGGLDRASLVSCHDHGRFGFLELFLGIVISLATFWLHSGTPFCMLNFLLLLADSMRFSFRFIQIWGSGGSQKSVILLSDPLLCPS